jgi:hypothetical protein
MMDEEVSRAGSVAKRSQRQQRTKNDRIGMEMNHNESYFL